MEDLGCKYFHELLAKSFFQWSSSGERSLFVMHDLINDLAQFVARSYFFRQDDNLNDNERLNDIRKARHSFHPTCLTFVMDLKSFRPFVRPRICGLSYRAGRELKV